MSALVTFQWDGEAMVPMKRFAKKCDEEFVIGEYYKMDVQNERSWASHKHYFAALHEAWVNLPEHHAGAPWAQSCEHLRKYALIKTGWNTSTSYSCESTTEARRWARHMANIDEFSVIVFSETAVIRYTAQSQSFRAMGAKDFQKSKDDVLEFVASLSGVSASDLKANAN